MRNFLKYALLVSTAITAVVLSLVFSFYLLKHSLIQENEALVHSVAHTILPALLVNDTAQVSSVMKSLETYPSIQTAELISSEGASLASFARDGYMVDPSAQGFELASATEPLNQVHVMAPLTFDSLIVANLHVVVNFWPIYLRLMIWAGIFLIVPSVLYVLVRHFKIKIRFERESMGAGPGGGGGGASYSLDRAMDEALPVTRFNSTAFALGCVMLTTAELPMLKVPQLMLALSLVWLMAMFAPLVLRAALPALTVADVGRAVALRRDWAWALPIVMHANATAANVLRVPWPLAALPVEAVCSPTATSVPRRFEKTIL